MTLNDVDFDAHNNEKPSGDLKLLTDAVKLLKKKQEDLSALEEEVKQCKKEIQRLESQEIPDQMDACSLKDLTLDTGEKLIVKAIVKASLPTKASIESQKDEDKRAALEHRLRKGLDWLRDNGGEELIKNRIVVEFSKGQDNLAGDFEGKAAEHNLPAMRDQSIHNASLSKFVAEKIKSGTEVPMDTLGVYCGRKAEVKKAR